MYNADCSRCACIHVPGVQPVTKGNLVSIFEKDGCGPRSTGFLLFDLFEIAYISCVRICVCVCVGIGTCTGFVFHYLFVLFPVFGRLVVSPPQVQVVFCYFRCTTMFLFSYR